MPEKPETSKSLALEIMPNGLSLITYDKDTPLECLAHAPMDDPNFDVQTETFRACAEAAVGKGFKTQIWLSDEHLRLHCAMLRGKAKGDRREEAAGALSAMSPYHASELCFDLGATDSEGYTPIAAIPKEKMDEALAFARKINLNPAGVTTSDDVVGFAARPVFEPLSMPQKAALPVRAAGVAALLALPFIGWNGGWFDGLTGDDQATSQHVAFVATVGPSVQPGEALDMVLPGAEAVITRPEVAREEMIVPTLATPVAAPEKHSAMVTAQDRVGTLATLSPNLFDSPHLRAVSQTGALPKLPRVDGLAVHVPSDLALAGPQALDGMTDGLRAPAETGHPQLRMVDVVQYARAAPPKTMFAGTQEEWRDARPRIETASAGLPGLTGITPAAARDFADPVVLVVSTGFDDSRAVRVANIGEGILVLKPPARTRTMVLQPSTSALPPPRPGPKLPEDAFDFSRLTPMQSDGEGLDTAPDGVTQMAPLPVLEGLAVLAPMDRDAPATVTPDLREARMDRAARLASIAPKLALARPPVRDVVPGTDDFGALVQLTVNDLLDVTPDVAEFVPAEAEFADVSPRFLAATRLAALSLDIAMERAAEPVNPLAGVDALPRPPARRSSASQTDIAAVVTDGLVPPPLRPSRRAEDTAADPEIAAVTLVPPPARTGPDAPEVATTEPESDTLAEVPATGEPSVEAVAAETLAELSLPRPPARTKILKQVAALTDPDAVFASPQAVPLALHPIARPSDLAARAAKIRASRSQQQAVAVPAAPGETTPAGALHLPSTAQVARVATIENGINLSGVSLIGIFGTSNARRALVRMPQGRYVQVKRGDRVRGWTVSAISDDNIRVQKGAQNSILRMPK